MHPIQKYEYPKDFQQRVIKLCGEESKITRDMNEGLDISGRMHDLVEHRRQDLELKTLDAIIKGDEVTPEDRLRATSHLTYIVGLEDLIGDLGQGKSQWLVKQPVLDVPRADTQPVATLEA